MPFVAELTGYLSNFDIFGKQKLIKKEISQFKGYHQWYHCVIVQTYLTKQSFIQYNVDTDVQSDLF
jgi:hypothetical protein